MMLQESIVVGDSRFQRFTMPLRVPNPTGGSCAAVSSCPTVSRSASVAITRSPGTGSVLSVEVSSSVASMPPVRLRWPVTSRFGSSTTWASTMRPAEVTNA